MLRLLFALCLLGPTMAAAGPFGIEMGAPIQELDTTEQGAKVELNSVPNPHPLFGNYSVWHTETHGVCRVLAISDTFENDRYGEDVRQEFERVRTAVGSKYGSGEEISYLRSGALWDAPEDWTMSILQSERTFAHIWEDVTDGIDRYSVIQLWVDALSPSDSLLIIEYRSVDFEACVAEIEGAQDDAF